MHRRSFLRAAAAAAPATALTNLLSHPTFAQAAVPGSAPELHPVAAGEDRFGSLHSLGFSDLAFKVGTEETGATSS